MLVGVDGEAITRVLLSRPVNVEPEKHLALDAEWKDDVVYQLARPSARRDDEIPRSIEAGSRSHGDARSVGLPRHHRLIEADLRAFGTRRLNVGAVAGVGIQDARMRIEHSDRVRRNVERREPLVYLRGRQHLVR